MFAVLALGCTRTQFGDRYEEPDRTNVCDSVSLIHGELTAQEFRDLFDCLNNMGSLDELEPLVTDLETTINPDTGESYLADVAALTDIALKYEDTPDALELAQQLVDSGAAADITPLAAELIDTGLAEAWLPVVARGIESGAVEEVLPHVADVLHDDDLPELLDGFKDLVDDGMADGWIDGFTQDVGVLLAVTDAQGDSAWRGAVQTGAAFMASGAAEELVPVVDGLIDDGTVEELASTNRDLYDQGVLQELDTQLRPMFAQDATGYSHMQGLLEIINGTNGPLSCLLITVTDNLAVTILDVMANRTEQDIQDLVDLIDTTLGLADLFCSIPPEVQAYFDSLDVLANSGALNGLLPLLRVFQDNGRLDELVELFVALHNSGALPEIEPVILELIDRQILDHIFDLVPHFVDASGNQTAAGDTLIELVNRFTSPRVGDDYETAPLAGILGVLGEAAGPGAVPIAESWKALGETILDPDSHFSDLAPVLSTALGADPNAQIAVLAGDFIETAAASRALPPLGRAIGSGHAESVLPWVQQVLEDGTIDEVISLVAGAVDLLRIQEQEEE